MADTAMMRTEYLNVSTGTVRTGATGHGESLTDVESYLLPQEQARGATLHSWGVAGGLTVRATAAGQTGITVTTGTALDTAGRTAVLATNGTAIVDPNVDPNEIVNIPTVTVGEGGLALATDALTGDRYATLTWREVLGSGVVANAPVLLHAPWLRLVPVAGFAFDGSQVVLAKVSLDAAGKVTALSAEGRRLAGSPTGRLELRVPRASGGGTPAVDQAPAAELVARADGGLAVNLLSGGTPRTALSVEPSSGGVAFPAGLTVATAGSRSYGLSVGADSRLRLTDISNGADRLVVDAAGNVGINLGTRAPGRPLHVEGNEIHSGGQGAGFSFADRRVTDLVNNPGNTGARWIWYALDGSARLWSGGDLLTISPTGEGGGLDVPRRMRVRQGGDSSAGIWFRQDAPPGNDRAFVGMAGDNSVGFWGNTGAGWGLQMDTTNGGLVTGGNSWVKGQFVAETDSWVNGALVTGGNAWANGQFVVGDASWVKGRLTAQGEFVAQGNAWANGQFVVGDASWVKGRLTAQGEFVAQGNAWANGQFVVGDASWVKGRLTAQGEFVAQGNAWANGQFVVGGEMWVGGALHKGGGGFMIDHPLAPEDKFLSHSFVESPDMVNLYIGVAVTDDDGTATVSLPDYFEALNRDHRFQLTTIGSLASATVDGEVRDNAFTIRTDKPGVTVSWQVTGVRQDPWAEANRIVVEQDKPADEQSRFLHPELYGHADDRSLRAAAPQQTPDAPAAAPQQQAPDATPLAPADAPDAPLLPEPGGAPSSNP